MPLHEYPRIHEIARNGFEFRFGDYISQGIDIFRKNMGNFIAFGLIAGLIILVTSFIPILGSIAVGLILGPALLCGVFIVARKVQHGEATTFNDFFSGFQYTGQLALTALVVGLITLLSYVPFLVVAGFNGVIEWYMEVLIEQDPEAIYSFPGVPFWSWLLMALPVYFSVAYSWSYMFVVFYNMNFWDAMEASRQIITKKWFLIFFFMIVTYLIGGLGVIILIIGILFSLPPMLIAQYSAFADVTGLNDMPGDEKDPLDHLVESN